MGRLKSTSFSTGLAIFSMFLGAGNITFPLIIGQNVGSAIFLALIGFILTGVVMPFAGLISMTFFDGDYRQFFIRIGRIPAWIIIGLLLGVIGPFGGIPRLVTLTFSTLKVYFPHLHLFSFSLISCGVIFLFSWKKSRIVDLIGYVFSPLLILSLVFIIIKGMFFKPEKISELNSVSNPFLYGIKEGYNTMDLIAAFFFSSLTYKKLKQQVIETKREQTLFPLFFKASLIGAFLLSMVYIGLGYVAVNYRNALVSIPIDQLIGKLGILVLGQYAGFLICLLIILTCLTTSIALTVISADFLQKQIFRNKLKYEGSIGIILGLTIFISSFEFAGIVNILSPVLQVIYPSLLVLCLFNVLHKTLSVKPIKIPVFMAMSLVLYFQHIA